MCRKKPADLPRRVELGGLRSECPAPLPRGHVCAQSTPPGRFGPGRLRWKTSCLEFRAGAAEEAWAKLREAGMRSLPAWAGGLAASKVGGMAKIMGKVKKQRNTLELAP